VLPVTRYRAVLVTALALANVGIFIAITIKTGRITQGEGRGWDGVAYVEMLKDGLYVRSNERLRPLIVVFNRPLFLLSDRSLSGALDAFASMNVVYMAWLTAASVLLASAYGASVAAQIFLALNISLCIATSKYFAYYPAVVDLGAYAVMTSAILAIVRGRPFAGPVLTVLAALSREFGIFVAVFGMHRGFRLTRKPWQAVAMYAPAVAVSLGWRLIVSRLPGDQLLRPGDFERNIALWKDYNFVAFFLYYCTTVFGGLSLLLVACGGRCLQLFRREPEWITLAGGIVVMAAVGNADIWRYLAYLLPLAVVLLATCDAQWSRVRRASVYSLGAVVTVVTQRPFEAMNAGTYLTHWFPYYVVPTAAPDDLERFWSYWGWMMLVTAVVLWMIAAFDTTSPPVRQPVAPRS
jgi:hypothetical protein